MDKKLRREVEKAKIKTNKNKKITSDEKASGK